VRSRRDPVRPPMTEPSQPPAPPTVVVVGAASRDITDDDPRGWRLGGGVSYSALTTARLGLRTGAIVGVDAEAAGAWELDLLRSAGVDVRLVPLEHGPIFVNIERPEGRLQECRDSSDPVPLASVPPEWLAAPGWILAPVAAELPAAWAERPGPEAYVAVGWQGLLRELVPGAAVHHVLPRPDPIISRADLVGLSRDDVDRKVIVEALYELLRPGASLVVTQGDRGGLVARSDDGQLGFRHYPAVPSHESVDPTGAGDVFLAALAAARIEPRLVGGRLDQGFDLLLAAAAASLVLEDHGLLGVPDRAAVRARISESRRAGAAHPA
jgi:sugar/nucleoside kinase (ribokinase family)